MADQFKRFIRLQQDFLGLPGLGCENPSPEEMLVDTEAVALIAADRASWAYIYWPSCAC